MISTVKVNAHCAPNKEVVLTRRQSAGEPNITVLQDGESTEQVVYADFSVTVFEREKGEVK